jgi:hypothetical protein
MDPPRPYRRPLATLSAAERDVLSWTRLGGSLQASAQLSGVPLGQVERWMEHPNGLHSAFVREVHKLNGSVNGQHPPTGNILGPNGNGKAVQ